MGVPNGDRQGAGDDQEPHSQAETFEGGERGEEIGPENSETENTDQIASGETANRVSGQVGANGQSSPSVHNNSGHSPPHQPLTSAGLNSSEQNQDQTHNDVALTEDSGSVDNGNADATSNFPSLTTPAVDDRENGSHSVSSGNRNTAGDSAPRNTASDAIVGSQRRPAENHSLGRLRNGRVFGNDSTKPNLHGATSRERGNSGVSVTLLTLDEDKQWRPHSRLHKLQQRLLQQQQQQQFLQGSNSPRQQQPSPDTALKETMSDVGEPRLIRDFQVRRKYGRRPTYAPPALSNRDKTFLDLGLSGTRYFNNGSPVNGSSNTTTTNGGNGGGGSGLLMPLDPNRTPRVLNNTPANQHLHNDSPLLAPNSTSVGGGPKGEEGLGLDSADNDLLSPKSSAFPPLSTPQKGWGTRSENSFHSGYRPMGVGREPTSLLVNHFGFTTIRPDTFSGIQRQRRLKVAAAAGNDDLIRELEQHAKRQILACQNMGYMHRGSRAAESVLSLKHTVSPSAFHPSAVFTKHTPRGEEGRGVTDRGQGSRSESPGGEGGAEKMMVGGRRGTAHHHHNHNPGGKLGMPTRLVLTDRQDQRSRAALPTVSGNGLQVLLAQANAK